MTLRSRAVQIRVVFRPEDPRSIVILRLVAAANDLATLLRMVTHMPERDSAEAAGTYRYAFRMAAVHIDAIKRVVRKELPEVVEHHARRGWRFADLPVLARALDGVLGDERVTRVLGVARQKFAGHYDADHFRKALTLVDRSELMEMPGRGVHHNVCDRLFDVVLATESQQAYGESDELKSAQRALEACFDVQEALFPLVQGLVFAQYMEADGR